MNGRALPLLSLFLASAMDRGAVARAATGRYTVEVPGALAGTYLAGERSPGTPRIGQPPTTPRALLARPSRGGGTRVCKFGARRLRRLRRQGVLA